MEIECNKCNTKLNVPDEKIPKDREIKINCPKCTNKIILDLRKKPKEWAYTEDSLAQWEHGRPRPAKTKQDEPATEDYTYEDYSSEEALDFFDEGAKIALVILKGDEKRVKIGNALEELGYRCIYAENTRDALGKLRFHSFNLVFLSDGFENQDVSYSPVMNFLNRLPMSSRRKIFVALLGDKFRTMDEMMAFSLSANSVINTKDIDKISSIMKKVISENEKFYKVLIDTLAEVGKE